MSQETAVAANNRQYCCPQQVTDITNHQVSYHHGEILPAYNDDDYVPVWTRADVGITNVVACSESGKSEW